MKLLLWTAYLLAATCSSFAQGTVLFQNYPNMDLVRMADGRPVPTGEGWTVELMAGTEPGAVARSGECPALSCSGHRRVLVIRTEIGHDR